MSAKDDKYRAQRLAESVAIDLRVVLEDARRMLEQFETYVESWDEQIAAQKEDPATHDPREMTQGYVVERAFEMLTDVEHVHSGSTRASRIRTTRKRLLQLAQAAPQH